MNDEIYHQNKNKLIVKDSKKFLKLLTGTDQESHQKLHSYAKKIINTKGADIPAGDYDSIANWAILKAIQSFDPDAGANFLTYLTIKIKGEITDYRCKRDSMTNKVHRMISQEANSDSGESYVYTYSSDKDSNTLDKVTEETPDSILHAEDIYYRRIQAFRMAFSGIPYYSQFILNEFVESKMKLKEIAERENTTVQEITKIRNHALSLILNRVLRSNHLSEEEKIEVKEEHGII